MDCCSVNGLPQEFHRRWALGDLRSYRKRGLPRRAAKVVGLLTGEGVSGATVLEIGCGIGGLHQALIKAGASGALGIDASPSYIEVARSLAEELGSAGSTEYRVGDFVDLQGQVDPADVAILDRVICCYPDVRALVTAAGSHARRLCVLTYPRRTWWIRLGVRLINVVSALRRREFRIYVHEPREVRRTLEAGGFSALHWDRSGVWEIAVFQRG